MVPGATPWDGGKLLLLPHHVLVDEDRTADAIRTRNPPSPLHVTEARGRRKPSGEARPMRPAECMLRERQSERANRPAPLCSQPPTDSLLFCYAVGSLDPQDRTFQPVIALPVAAPASAVPRHSRKSGETSSSGRACALRWATLLPPLSTSVLPGARSP
jgi:hypothetical protein